MKKLLKAALIRAIRTFAQGALAIIGTNALLLSDVNWLMVFSGGALAAVISLLMSLAGLPEVKNEDSTGIPDKE